MSSSHIQIFCLIFSCFIHWQILGIHWTSAISTTYDFQAATLESGGHFQGNETSFALQQMLEQISEDRCDSGENRQKKVLAHYLKKIKREIALNKFSGMGTDGLNAIGNAQYFFLIDGKGRFNSIRLIKTSGNPLIDNAAQQAIYISSQKIKRPDSIGTDAITLYITVKYQYGL